MKFKLTSHFKPTGDQPEAIRQLTEGLTHKVPEQVLLGVTGSGKTFTMANIIAETQRPTLIISHNKTLAAQLYQEFKSFFAKNAVSYFVSYYDYYQPEAYVPQTDTYIEKETEINEEIDKLRLASTTNLLTRNDTIIIASVSCIYNIGSPKEYGNFILDLRLGLAVSYQSILARLVELQYERSDYGFHRGTFRVRGDTIDIFPAYEDTGVRVEHDGRAVKNISRINTITGELLETVPTYVLYPAKHYMTDPNKNRDVFALIEKDLNEQIATFKAHGKELEAHRLHQKVHYDLEMIQEVGFVNGIENYSRYFDGRKPGEAPYTLFDYYQEMHGNDWLLFIDESHMTVPQVRGMYNGDRSRKQTLIDFGFRLPSALDNRPLKFDEFLRRIPQTIYVSATPSEWEISRALEAGKNNNVKISNSKKNRPGIVEQLIRPTGLIDPEITIKPVEGQIKDLEQEIRATIAKGERILVTTLTKRMAEDLATYLSEQEIKVHYLHADILTLERSDILDDLRNGKYDVIVGINLLREGLDLPEVSLVAILDADKEGFLRSDVALIQTMGRAARHLRGRVIMYADRVTGSMQRAINEVKRRREIQMKYNTTHGITPQTINKPIREKLVEKDETELDPVLATRQKHTRTLADDLSPDTEALTPQDIRKLVKRLEKEMRFEAENLNFELAAKIRDRIRELKSAM
jgi:excinuclease ABC subunit B